MDDFKMNTERILESWENSPKIQTLPEYLRHIILKNFSESTELMFTDEIEDYLKIKIEQFKPILSAAPFNKQDDMYDQAFWSREDHLSVLRNLATVFWFQEGQIADINELYTGKILYVVAALT